MRLAASVVIAALIPCAGLAHAQQVPVRPVDPREGAEVAEEAPLADLKLGPFYLQPRLGVRDLGWDSNILGASATSGLQVSDFRATPIAGLRLFLPIRSRHVFSADGEVGYAMFLEYKELRGWNTAVEGRYEYDSDRLEVSVADRYVDAQTNQLERLELDSGPTTPDPGVFQRIRTRTNDLSADLRFFFTSQTYVGGRGSRAIVRYDDSTAVGTATAASLDRTEDTVGGVLGTRLRPSVSVQAFYDWQEYDYETPGNPRDATTYRTGLELLMEPGSRASGLIRAGYRRLTPLDPDQQEFDGLVGDMAVTAILGGRVEMSVNGTRDAYPALWYDSTYFLLRQAGLELVYQATRAFGIGGAATAGEYDYNNEATEILPDGTPFTAERRDLVYRYEGLLRWRLDRNEIRFRVGYYDVTSNFVSQEQDGLIVSTGYVARF